MLTRCRPALSTGPEGAQTEQRQQAAGQRKLAGGFFCAKKSGAALNPDRRGPRVQRNEYRGKEETRREAVGSHRQNRIRKKGKDEVK